MYASFFGLDHEPFSIAPDPRYLFMSERHREALAHLLYGVGSRDRTGGAGGGVVLLSGEIGTGKTTVCRCFLDQMPPHCQVAYIFNPKLTVTELLQSICDEFHLTVAPQHAPPTVKDYLDPLNAFLLHSHAQGRNSVLIIDEAQNLSAEVLEQLRLLTNLETNERKLLQIILIGQPELRDLLASPALEQLGQRVVARYHLEALSEAETRDYMRHRLEVAGLRGALPFDAGAQRLIHRLSGGVPRRINLLCDRALLGAFAQGQARVGRAFVEQAASEVFYRPRSLPQRRDRAVASVAAVTLVVGAGLWVALRGGVFADLPERVMTGSDPVVDVIPRVTSETPRPAASALAVTAADAPASLRPVAASVPVLLQDEAQAWRELARAWQVTDLGDGAPCPQLARQGVYCFSRISGLPLIRQLGRPGIVTLDRDTARPSYAVLARLTDDSATLQAAGTEQTVTLTALAARWKGDFATLWRAPEGYRARTSAADRGPAVRWAASQLAALDGSAAALPERAVLDGPMQARLRTFQLAQGLPVDGRLTPLTFMQLNRLAGVDEPRLHAGP